MQSILRRVAAAALFALPLAVFVCPLAWSEAAKSTPPEAVMEAIAAAPAPDSPAQVIVGAYINDIQELDFKANNYVVDLYVWFRWKRSDLDPSTRTRRRRPKTWWAGSTGTSSSTARIGS